MWAYSKNEKYLSDHPPPTKHCLKMMDFLKYINGEDKFYIRAALWNVLLLMPDFKNSNDIDAKFSITVKKVWKSNMVI